MVSMILIFWTNSNFSFGIRCTKCKEYSRSIGDFNVRWSLFLEVKHIKHPHYSLSVQSNNIGRLPTPTPIPTQAWHGTCVGQQTTHAIIKKNNDIPFLFFSLVQLNIVNHMEEKPLAVEFAPHAIVAGKQ